MAGQAALLPGTLDVLILKSVSLGPLHGYAVLARIEQITQGALLVEQGTPIPFHRLGTGTVVWSRGLRTVARVPQPHRHWTEAAAAKPTAGTGRLRIMAGAQGAAVGELKAHHAEN